MRTLAILVVVTGCSLYFGPPGPSLDPPPPGTGSGLAPDAAITAGNNPACNLSCQPDYHVEVDCEPAGTGSCIEHCHCACVPNESCATIDCGPKTCVQTCSHECEGMPEICVQACSVVASPPPCETATTETGCLARPGCLAVYRGTGCTCAALACECTNDQTAFARCETAPAM